MNYKIFSSILFGMFFIGVSVGYVLGYYIYKYINYNYLFYLSAIFMGFGCFLLIYGSIILNGKKNNDKEECSK